MIKKEPVTRQEEGQFRAPTKKTPISKDSLYEPINMKSQDYNDVDGDYLDDPILLNFEETEPRLEHLQFLDPGIIDLDCDSEEDCKYIDENTTDISLPEGATSFQPITNRDSVRPMCIKLVDCYKFPWYFDQPTKDIIENKLAMNSVDISISGQPMDVSSKEFRNIVDKCLNETINNNAFCNGVNNNVNEQIIDFNSNEFREETTKYVNKEIDFMNRIHDKFSTRTYNSTKPMANTKTRNDIELMKAMCQKNQTGVDLKKNKGLIGMKIKRITTNRQHMELKNNRKQHADTEKGKNEHKIQKIFVQAVDKALTNIGTTMTPVFGEISGNNNKESGLRKHICQDVKPNSSIKFPDSFTRNLKILENLEYANSTNNLTLRDNISEESMSKKINETTKVAEEIVKIIISQRGGIYHIKDKDKHKPSDDKRKLCKAMPLSKKREETKATLKQKSNTEGCKMTKMIMPIPLTLKARKKEKIESLKQSKVIKVAKKPKTPNNSLGLLKKYTENINTAKTESKYVKDAKQEIVNKQTPKVVFVNPVSEERKTTERSDAKIPNKSFKTLNKFTKNILDKIEQKHVVQQSKIKKLDKIHKKHTKMVNYVVQPKSIDECKLRPSESIAKTTKEDGIFLRLPTHFSDETSKDKSTVKVNNNASYRSPKLSLSQLQHSNKNNPGNSPKINKANPDIETNTLPLNIITAKTGDAKINVVNSINFLENTYSNGYNNLDKQPNIESLSSTKTIATKGSRKQYLYEDRTIENDNSKPMHTAQISPVYNAAQQAKDKYTIQTIITSRNELNVGKHETHAHDPIIQVPTMIIIRPTQAQNVAQVRNKPLTVHNSMQSHILYKPQAENQSHQMYQNNPEALRYQVSIQQKNQAIYQQSNNWYPPLYTDVIASKTPMNVRPPSEVNAGIPQMAMNNGTIPSDIYGPSLAHMGMNVPIDMNRGITHMAMNNKLTPSGVNRLIPPQMRCNARPSGFCADVTPLMTMNVRPIPPRVNRPISQQMAINAIPQGVNVGIPARTANSDRPSGYCDIQPGEVFWSYAFPPPKLLPPPPPLPIQCQETTRLLFTSQAIDSSIIGRNNDGIIKKINITTPVDDHNMIYGKEGTVKVENVDSDSTPLYDEVPECQPVNTKSEMLRVLDTSMQRMQSPVKHLHGTISKQSPTKNPTSMSNRSPNESINLSSQHLQKNEQLVNISKHKLPQHIQPTKSNYNLETMPIKSTRIPTSTQLFDDNIRPTKSSKRVNESYLNHVSNLKAPPMKTEYSASNSKKHFEDHNIHSSSNKRLDNTSPSNFKSAIPINKTKNSSATKYKPGPLSKKIKFNDLRASPRETNSKVQMISSKGYSSPILPIPTYEKILSEITPPFTKIIDRPVKNSFDNAKTMKKLSNTYSNEITEKRIQFEQDRTKVDSTKKISLDEYKKRSASERTDDEPKSFMNKRKESFMNNTVHMHRRASNVDSDLGYDSDVTVTL